MSSLESRRPAVLLSSSFECAPSSSRFSEWTHGGSWVFLSGCRRSASTTRTSSGSTPPTRSPAITAWCGGGGGGGGGGVCGCSRSRCCCCGCCCSRCCCCCCWWWCSATPPRIWFKSFIRHNPRPVPGARARGRESRGAGRSGAGKTRDPPMSVRSVRTPLLKRTGKTRDARMCVRSVGTHLSQNEGGGKVGCQRRFKKGARCRRPTNALYESLSTSSTPLLSLGGGWGAGKDPRSSHKSGSSPQCLPSAVLQCRLTRPAPSLPRSASVSPGSAGR